jgi:hypothetical protein
LRGEKLQRPLQPAADAGEAAASGRRVMRTVMGTVLGRVLHSVLRARRRRQTDVTAEALLGFRAVRWAGRCAGPCCFCGFIEHVVCRG